MMTTKTLGSQHRGHRMRLLSSILPPPHFEALNAALRIPTISSHLIHLIMQGDPWIFTVMCHFSLVGKQSGWLDVVIALHVG